LLLFLDPGSEIRDPGWVKIRIRDKHPGSATLVLLNVYAIYFMLLSFKGDIVAGNFESGITRFAKRHQSAAPLLSLF
jgi:hypothetical protein